MVTLFAPGVWGCGMGYYNTCRKYIVDKMFGCAVMGLDIAIVGIGR